MILYFSIRNSGTQHFYSLTIVKVFLMMRKVAFLLFFCFALLAVTSSYTQAQTGEEVKELVHKGLIAGLKDSYPHHFCACNSCKHHYNRNLKVAKMKRYKEKILVWGKATAKYSSLSRSDNVLIEVYAEVNPKTMELLELKWRPTPCLQYRVLVGN